MIRIVLSLLMIVLASQAYAQGVGVNSDGSTPHPSAILDVKSTSQGVLLPRMTNEQRDLLSDPAEGLMFFNIETGRINYFSNGLWYEIFGSIVSEPNPTCSWSQDFTGLNSLPVGWTTSHPSQWTVNSSNDAGGISPELEFYYLSYNNIGQFWVRTDLINMSSCSNLELSFKHYVDHYLNSFALRVQTSTNGTVWIDQSILVVNNDIPATTWTIDLSSMDNQSFYLRFMFDGDEFDIYGWYIDDIAIVGY